MTSSAQMSAQRPAILARIPFITAEAVESFCDRVAVDNIFRTVMTRCEGIRTGIDHGIAG